MILFAGIFLLVMIILFVLVIVAAFAAEGRIDGRRAVAILLASGFLCLLVKSLYTLPKAGAICEDKGMVSLSTNDVYETVISTSTKEGVVVAILRTRDGKLIARELKVMPPPLFKRVDNEDNPYQPFP
jgi:hypothetical protein